MLSLEHIRWSLPGAGDILNDISLRFAPGRMTVVTGPNGGGKTSLAKVIAGVEQATGGRIVLNGEDLTNASVTERARRGIAYAFQQPVRFKGITVRDMLELAAGGQLNEAALCALLG